MITTRFPKEFWVLKPRNSKNFWSRKSWDFLGIRRFSWKRGKGQIVAHPLVLLLLLAGFVMLLLLGVKILKSIEDNRCKSTLITLESNLKSDIAEIAEREGSVRQKSYQFMCDADALYFMDTAGNIPQDAFNHSVEIQNSLFGSTGLNLFVLKKGKVYASFNIGPIAIEHPYYL